MRRHEKGWNINRNWRLADRQTEEWDTEPTNWRKLSWMIEKTEWEKWQWLNNSKEEKYN